MYTRRSGPLEEYIEMQGSMSSPALRTETCSQPGVLLPGDVLAGGLVVAKHPDEGGNGGVKLGFIDGSKRVVAGRIPLLLEGEGYGKRASEFRVGDIFENSDVVLSSPEVLDHADPRYLAQRHEVAVHITGGLHGHSVEVPHDIMVALSDESYPPSRESLFGKFVIDRTLGMGASARKNLPDYGRLDGMSESERVEVVFSDVDRLRDQGQAQRAAYKETVQALQLKCQELRGVELLITGRLRGRRNTVVHSNNPDSWVENLHIVIGSASVNTHEGDGSLITDQLPFIAFDGRTVEEDEHVSGWIGVDKFGVDVEVVSNDPQN